MKKLLTQIKTILDACLTQSKLLTKTEFALLKLVTVPCRLFGETKWRVELNGQHYQFEVLGEN